MPQIYETKANIEMRVHACISLRVTKHYLHIKDIWSPLIKTNNLARMNIIYNYMEIYPLDPKSKLSLKHHYTI